MRLFHVRMLGVWSCMAMTVCGCRHERGEPFCAVTDGLSKLTAEGLCKGRDCEVCMQDVDEDGVPFLWMALENASECDCPEPQVVPRR